MISEGSTFPNKIQRSIAAMLGATLGDAMGWPNERRSRPTSSIDPLVKLPKWERQVRSNATWFQEPIDSGEYSDDTQLILSCARSLLDCADPFFGFAKRELPSWLLYERGGGSATLRAANAWRRDKAPWDVRPGTKELASYFGAGGNGVAMRVLPFCIWGASNQSFDETRRQILENGITTHGHPRALIGAEAYGFAAWYSLRLDRTLKFGELLHTVLENKKSWLTIADSPVVEDWLERAELSHNGEYVALWEDTAKEIEQLLTLGAEELDKAPLAVTSASLERIGCMSKTFNGSGTISAAGAIFLASRHSADPMNGILEGAFALGADTDTLASMAGGILGAINGSDWLQPFRAGLQDHAYIADLAEGLAHANKRTRPNSSQTSSRSAKLSTIKNGEDLEKIRIGEEVGLLDGRTATLKSTVSLSSSTRGRIVTSFRFVAYDGQTLTMNHIQKGTSASQLAIHNPNVSNLLNVTGLRIVLRTLQYERSRDLYTRILGLRISHEGEGRIFLERSIVLVDISKDQQLRTNLTNSYFQIPPNRVELEFDVHDLRGKKLELRKAGFDWPERPTSDRYVEFQDYDGNVVRLVRSSYSED